MHACNCCWFLPVAKFSQFFANFVDFPLTRTMWYLSLSSGSMSDRQAFGFWRAISVTSTMKFFYSIDLINFLKNSNQRYHDHKAKTRIKKLALKWKWKLYLDNFDRELRWWRWWRRGGPQHRLELHRPTFHRFAGIVVTCEDPRPPKLAALRKFPPESYNCYRYVNTNSQSCGQIKL